MCVCVCVCVCVSVCLFLDAHLHALEFEQNVSLTHDRRRSFPHCVYRTLSFNFRSAFISNLWSVSFVSHTAQARQFCLPQIQVLLKLYQTV